RCDLSGQAAAAQGEEAEGDLPLPGEARPGPGQQPSGHGTAAAVQPEAGRDEDEIAGRFHGILYRITPKSSRQAPPPSVSIADDTSGVGRGASPPESRPAATGPPSPAM